jgi:hypothetical protein
VRQSERAAALAPRDTRPLLLAAGLHARSGGLADAVRCFKAAESADPSDPVVAAEYALFLLRSGDPAGGMSAAEACSALPTIPSSRRT